MLEFYLTREFHVKLHAKTDIARIAKEVFYASSRIFSSVQNKEEPPARYKKRFCLFLTLQNVTMVLRTF